MGDVLNKRILRAQQKYGIKCTVCGISAGSLWLSVWESPFASPVFQTFWFLSLTVYLIVCWHFIHVSLTGSWITFFLFVWYFSLLSWQQTLLTLAPRCKNWSYALSGSSTDEAWYPRHHPLSGLGTWVPYLKEIGC